MVTEFGVPEAESGNLKIEATFFFSQRRNILSTASRKNGRLRRFEKWLFVCIFVVSLLQ
jgi:hypothetical protein